MSAADAVALLVLEPLMGGLHMLLLVLVGAALLAAGLGAFVYLRRGLS